MTVNVQLSQIDAQNKYRITNLLDDKVLPEQTGKELTQTGITLNLKPGQAFVLKFETE